MPCAITSKAFCRLFPNAELPGDTVFVYTADHGESLAEQGEEVAHCGLGRQEAIVPLFMLGYDGVVDTSYRASHQNLFATLLDLMGVPESSRKLAYQRSLLRRRRRTQNLAFMLAQTSASTTQGSSSIERLL